LPEKCYTNENGTVDKDLRKKFCGLAKSEGGEILNLQAVRSKIYTLNDPILNLKASQLIWVPAVKIKKLWNVDSKVLFVDEEVFVFFK